MGTIETPCDAYNMSPNQLKNYTVYSGNAERFLSPDNTASILVGAKGSGKSLLLLKKHLQLQSDARDGQVVFSPKHGPKSPVNKDKSVQWMSIGKTLKAEEWQKCWLNLLCLCAYNSVFRSKEGFRNLNQLLDDEFSLLDSDKRNSQDISVLYESLLDSLSRRADSGLGRGKFYEEFLSALDASPNLISVVIYCDAIDESMANFKYQSNRAPDQDAVEPMLPWLNAQAGLALAQWHLRSLGAGISSRLSVFSSIRPEALPLIHQRLQKRNVSSLQIRDHFIELTYTEKDLEKIAVQVAAEIGMDKRRLFSLRCNWRCFFRNESLFRALVRHTFLLPRQLIFLLQEINKLWNPEDEDDPEFLASRINSIAADLITDYCKFFVPPWTSESTRAFSGIKRSFILKSEWQNIDPYFRESALNAGLIGLTANDGAKRILKFSHIRMDDIEKMADADFFMMHPLLVELIWPNKNIDRQEFSSGLFLGGEGEVVPSAKSLGAKPQIKIYGSPGEGLRASGIDKKGVHLEFDRVTSALAGVLCVASVMFGRETPGSDEKEPSLEMVLPDLIRAMSVLIHHRLLNAGYQWGLRVATERVVKKQDAKINSGPDFSAAAYVSTSDVVNARSTIRACMGTEYEQIPDVIAVLVAKILAKRPNDWRALRTTTKQMKSLGAKVSFGQHGKLPSIESYTIRLDGCEKSSIKVTCSRSSWPHPVELAHGSASFGHGP